MSGEHLQVLMFIGIVTVFCSIMSPMLWWILPDRSHQHVSSEL